MADITSSDFKQLIQAQQETNKLLRLKQVSDSKPDPEKYIKEELLPSKKLAAKETKEREAVDNANEGVSEALSLGIIEEQEKTTKAILAMSAADDLTTRLKVAEEAAQAELTEKANIKSAKETSAFQKMGKFFDGFSKKFDKIPGSKSLMAILKGTLFGGALLALLSFIQSPEFGEILKTLTGPIARGLAYLWTDIIKPIGNFLMGMITGDHPFLTGIRELGKDFGFSEENSNGLATVIGGLAAALTVAVLFNPFIAAGLLVGGVWKFTKLAAGIGAISKLFSTLGTATAGVGATATTATAGISATAVKLNNRRIKAAVRANPSLGKAVISNAGNVVRQFTASGAVNSTFAPTQRAFNQRMSGAQPAKLPGRFGRFAAIPIIGRLFAVSQLYDILTSGQSTAQMIPQVAGIFGGLGAASLGALAGATMGAAMTLNPLGGFIGSLVGGAVGYYTGDKLAMGLSQFMLGQPVTVLSDSMNERINSVGGPSGVMESPAVQGVMAGVRMGVGQSAGALPSSTGEGGGSMKLPMGGGNGDAIVLNTQDSINNYGNNQTHQTFATNLFPNDPVMHQVAAAR